MKPLIKLAVLPALLLVAGVAQAASLADLQVKDLDKIYISKFVDYNDSSLMNVTYVGASTECVLTITSYSVTAYAPEGTADSNFGTSGVYRIDNTAYDTIGELCDAIDADTGYECSLNDGKRNDASNLLLDQTAASGTNDAKSAGGFNILLDSGTYTSTTALALKIGITPQSGRRVILKNCISNSNTTPSLIVYGKLRKYEHASDGVTRNDTTAVWTSVASVDDTTTIYPYNSASWTGQPWLEFGKDEHVVISETGTAVQAAGTNFMMCFWEEK